MIKLNHSFYSGLGGHTAVFWAQQKYAQENGYSIYATLYGIEFPLESTLKGLDKKQIPSSFLLKRGRWDLFHPIRVALQIKNVNPDIIFIHGSYAILPIYLLCSAFKKTKIIIRETQAITLKTTIDKIRSLFGLFLSNHIVFLSEEYRADYFGFKADFLLKKTSVIPNGLDLEQFRPASTKGDHDFIIGMQSRLVPIKDYNTLILAISKLNKLGYKNVKLQIAGDGSMRPSIEQYVKELDIQNQVTLLGLLDAADLPAYLNGLHVYVHSSLGETMSNSIMQAQSCGLPIVATNVFGINNVIKNCENGFLFTLGNVDELVDILIKLINNPGLRNEMGMVSRTYAVNFLSDKIMAEKYYSLFNMFCIKSS